MSTTNNTESSQKEVTVARIIAKMGGDVSGKVVRDIITKTQKREIADELLQDYKSGLFLMSDKARANYPTDLDVRKKYIPGVISDRLRKDLRLTNGTTYVTQNKHARDEQILALKKVRKLHPDQADVVDEQISKRLEHLNAQPPKAKKAKKPSIDLTLVPTETAVKLGLVNG